MKKYLFNRILRSLFSIFMVTTLVYLTIFSLVPRNSIFKDDPAISKLKSQPDQLLEYQNSAFDRMGYINYLNQRDFQKEVQKDYPEFNNEESPENQAIIEKWKEKNTEWEVGQLPIGGGYYATNEISIGLRVLNFYKNLLQIDHPWRIKDPENPDLKRGYQITHDKTVGWALTGSGTKYYYQIYFNNKFPFIHQNFLKMDLGVSYPTFAGQKVVDVITHKQGRTVTEKIVLPDGKEFKSSINPYSRYYKPTSELSLTEKRMFEGSNYAGAYSINEDPSMMMISFRNGVVAVILTYLISVPMAMAMARYKGQWVDKLGTVIITLLISVPSVAFIFFGRYIGNKFFGLPDLFPILGPDNIKSYIMPVIILALLGLSGSVMWIRRYMVDQQSSDYVKFARSKGLSEAEISRKHIFRNAIIPIVNGIPGAIIASIGGALITEKVFAIPGMGKMLPDAITAHNNPITVGLVFIFSVLGVISILLGDISMTLVDPRIRLEVKEDK
ncbi:ABC transporter permease [Facklamia miroungae]|uniref:Oligopeptide transport system permease protein n=1 Tax=Facklamia miroungae TaxID=120956 RepID=A0A1G7UMU6_9LACT|nr:ABC transporter permease [Facklamia miroungae]NKZ30191.1 ABC transporter permease [Facklamia miroungae]SDG48925.1 oligopeptide transport system permease protein [Facklamia miroungae]